MIYLLNVTTIKSRQTENLDIERARTAMNAGVRFLLTDLNSGSS